MSTRGSLSILAGPLLWAAPAGAQSTFQHVTVDSSGPGEMHVKGVGDLNGDGYQDLIIGSTNGSLVWYEDRSSPGLWTRHSVATTADGLGGWSTDLETFDPDADGDLDILTSDWEEHDRLVWFENLGNAGSWSLHVIGSPRAHDIELGDLDGDGDQDLVTREQLAAGGVLRLWRQDTPTTWSQAILGLASVTSGEGLDVADIDHDGDPDVAIVQYWYENTGDFMAGDWVEHEYTSAYTHPHSIVKLADMDTDGDLDVLVTPSEFAGGFGRTSWFAAPADPRDSAWVEHVIDPSVERVTHSLQVADFDLDGDLDVVTAEMHQGADPDEVRLYDNLDGQGTSWSKAVLGVIGSHNLQVVDVGADGDLDLFGANWTQSQQVDLWENLSTGAEVYCIGSNGCPCGNVTHQGGGCRPADGLGARLTWIGSTSVSADDLELRATDVPDEQSGVMFMGQTAIGVPFGDGRRCVSGQTFRFGVSNSGSPGLFVVGPGVVGLARALFEPAGHVGPGQTWYFQTWYRDPGGPCGSGFNLSNGLALTFQL